VGPSGHLTPQVAAAFANLIVVEGARKRGVRISFVTHLAIGLPVTVVTLVFGLWWLRTFAS
jgi:Na+/H+ antiporter NhaD/arsenite permease-like protein